MMALDHRSKWRGHWPNDTEPEDIGGLEQISDDPITDPPGDEGGWRRPDWMAQGACVGAERSLFFPKRRDDKSIDQAKAICARCTVVDICLEYAIRHEIDYGVWGGCTGLERRKLERAARAAGEL